MRVLTTCDVCTYLMADEPLQLDEAASQSLRDRLLELPKQALSWAFANRLKAGLVAAGVMILMGGLGWFMSGAGAAEETVEAVTLAGALEMLDQGEYSVAREMAHRLINEKIVEPTAFGGPAFVLGAATYYEAEKMWDPDERLRYFELASRFLEEARDRGLPARREAEGLSLLGKSLRIRGKFAQAIPILKQALEGKPKNRSELEFILAESYFRDANPKLRHALNHTEAYLADRMLTDKQRHAALLMESMIYLRLQEIDACQEKLEEIPTTAKNRSDVIVMRGRLLMHKADQLLNKEGLTDDDRRVANKILDKAIKVLRLAEDHDTLGSHATRKAQYLIGVCHRKLGKPRAALAQFGRCRKLYFNTSEGLIASLEEAELQRSEGQHDEAIISYRRSFRGAGEPFDFTSPWLSLDEFRGRMHAAYTSYLEQGRFDIAVELTDFMHPMFPRDEATQFKAEAYRAWADNLHTSAEGNVKGKGEALRQESRSKFRSAGYAYARLAKLHLVSSRYPEDLWLSAESFLKGRNYKQAVQVFREYLKNESRRRRARALVGIGQALLALDKIDESIDAFDECIKLFPKDPAVYEARIWGAKALVEIGDFGRAKEVLLDNLHNESLTPRSHLWRDSLFELGRVYYLDGIKHEVQSRAKGDLVTRAKESKKSMHELELAHAAFVEAQLRLEEAVNRYPDDRAATRARYLAAESHRQAAKLPFVKLTTIATAETTKVELNKQIQHELRNAIAGYSELQKQLNQKEELTSLEAAMLRNCYFSRGAAYFKLGRYEDAITAYSDATNRYQKDPTALEAYVQIATAFNRLNKPDKARGTLEQAKIVLSRIEEGTSFEDTTRFKRKKWEELLDWLVAQYRTTEEST